MIKGPLNTYDYRFGDKINSFIKLVSFISIEYKTIKDNSAGSVNKTLFFEFNGYKSAKLFSKGLNNSYTEAINEIEETLLINFRKYERLNYVSNLLLKFADVKTLLRHDSKTGYKHKNLKYINANKANVNDESYFQEYYALIDQYLNKIIQYLKVHKHSQGVLADCEIPIHKKNTTAPEKSTKENPFKFFRYITTKIGISSFLNEFKPTKEDFSNSDIVYDDITNIITYNHYDVEREKHSTTTQSFNHFLKKRLNLEFLISKQLIEEHFKSLKDELQASFYLKRVFKDLKRLEINALRDKEALGYAEIKDLIKTLSKYLKTKYNSFIVPENANDDKALFFQLKGNVALIHEKAKNLHSSLVKNEFLEKNSKKDFVKLFTSQGPLNKITWLGQINELKLFINLLISEDKIEKCTYGKWQIVAANFKSNDANFSSEQLKDAKSPTNKTKIENIVSKMSH